MNVFIEGQPAVRHLDLLTHNHMAKKPGNTPPSPWMSAMTAGAGPAPGKVERNAREGKDWLELELVDLEGQRGQRLARALAPGTLAFDT